MCVGCEDDPKEPVVPNATGVYNQQGRIRPSATADEEAVFQRGEKVAQRRFTPEEGLGPLFTVTFCAACHEKPVFGGGGGRYRFQPEYLQRTVQHRQADLADATLPAPPAPV